jgi:cytochrome c-type biogenesis protein CcmE
MRTITKVGVTLAVVVAGGGLLVASSLSHAQHFRMADELVHEGLGGWGDTEIKVFGSVESGSIAQQVIDQQMTRSFVLEKNGARVRVFSRGPAPDTFKDRAEIVATGHLVPARDMMSLAAALRLPNDSEAWVLDASELMAKCPDHYDAPARSAHPNPRGSDK